jgi:sugar phosphate permease
MASAHHDAAFLRTRRIVFGIVLLSFVLSFFHRTAPAAIAAELARTFAINAATLGTLAATYFYMYTVLQIPVGVLADTVGPRKLLAGGSLIAGIGSLAFGLAPSWEVAAIGRTLVGVGTATAFIAILKISAVWFPPQRFATLNGVTMFAGNAGAVVAGAPLAWLVGETSWRNVFLGLAALSLALAAATWWRVRDRPQDAGFAPVNTLASPASREPWTHALGVVLRNARTWPGFFVNMGIGGSYPRSPGCGPCRISWRCTACRASPPPSTRACCCSAWRSAPSPSAGSPTASAAAAGSCVPARCSTRCRGFPGSCT